MRHINGLYTQRFNRRRDTDGPLFRGWFKAILVEADSYLLQLSRYIHRNPVEVRTPQVSQLELPMVKLSGVSESDRGAGLALSGTDLRHAGSSPPLCPVQSLCGPGQ